MQPDVARKLKPIPHPRRLGACAVAIMDVLDRHGIAGAEFFKPRHAVVKFEYRGHRLTYHFPTTPRSADNACKRHSARLEKLIEGVRR